MLLRVMSRFFVPILSIDFFATGKILKHSTEGLLYERFQHYETTNFSTKILTSPLHTLIYTFSISEINERLKGSPTAFFGTVGQNFFEGTLDISPHLLSSNFSATRKILRHSTEGSSTKSFCTVRRNFSKENLDTSPSLLSQNFSTTRKFLKHSTERFLYKMLLYCETKSLRRKIVT